jgi:arylsulfatase A-like enzyme/GT2 family glycosyltransferase/SAM-dependent methyltransferase
MLERSRPSKIILIVIDCLRADHLGCYGYPRETSPNIDLLARESIRFKWVFSACPYTVPSHASMLTGKYPSHHSFGFSNGWPITFRPDEENMLPEILSSHGYETAGFVSAMPLRKQVGISTGFKVYDDCFTKTEPNRPEQLLASGEQTNQKVIPWIADHKDKDFFLFIHYFDVHGPYVNPGGFKEVFKGDRYYGDKICLEARPDNNPVGGIPAYQVLNPIFGEEGHLLDYENSAGYYIGEYDAGIKYCDHHFGVLLKRLKEFDISNDTLLMMTSDHGEAMGENQVWFYHGLTLTPDQIHVPLIIKPHRGWNVRPQIIETQISHVDLFPTISELAGFDSSETIMDGKSLTTLIETGTDKELESRTVLSEIEGQIASIDGEILDLKKKAFDSEKRSYAFVEGISNKEMSVHYREERAGSKCLSAKVSDIDLCIDSDDSDDLLQQVTDLREALHERERILKQKDARLFHLAGFLRESESKKEILKRRLESERIQVAQLHEKEVSLERIYQSHGWKVLAGYYKLREVMLPVNTKRRVLSKLIFRSALAIKKTPAIIGKAKIGEIIHGFFQGLPRKVPSGFRPDDLHRVERRTEGQIVQKCYVCGVEINFSLDGRVDNLRETVICHSCHSMKRSIDLAEGILKTYLIPSSSLAESIHRFANLSIYEVGHTGSIHDVLSRLPYFTCSEFATDVKPGNLMPSGIRCEDVQSLTFKNNVFDLVISQEVFEHVPQPGLGFQEIYRVLKPGGYHIFTIPYHKGTQESLTRAVVQDGEIKHFLNPVYHGDPSQPMGTLVFTDFGDDLIGLLGRLGFEVELFERDNSHYKDGRTTVFVTRKSVSDPEDVMNDWDEGCHLESDPKHGRPYLEATKGGLSEFDPRRITDQRKEQPIEAWISGEYEKLVFKATEEPLVSIVIPVHNGWNVTYPCLSSVLRNSEDLSYEIILADDASVDETINISVYTENIRVIRNAENLGFLKNGNKAAGHARGKYILFLNNDTLVRENWMGSLLELMERDGKIGMVGSKLIFVDGTLQQAGGIIWSDGSVSHYGRGDDSNKPEFNYIKEVDYVSGACFMIRSDLWKKIGGFDTAFSPAYYEDVDLAFGARKQGYKVIYQPRSVVVHLESVSYGAGGERRRERHQIRNQRRFVEKWKDVLDSRHVADPQDTFHGRDRSKGKETILVVDQSVPDFDKYAGSRTSLHYLKIFLELGLNVKFIDDNYMKHGFRYEPYTTRLEQLGIEVLSHDWYRENWGQWVNSHARSIDYAYLNRPISIDYIDTLRRGTKAKIIYNCIDFHYLREMREYEKTKDKPLLKLSKEHKKQEFYLFRKSDVVLTYSHYEKSILGKRLPKKNVQVIPLFAYDEDLPLGPSTDFEERKGLVFVGGFAHSPNVDGILWFINDVFPKILDKNPEMELSIIGSDIPEAISKFESKHICPVGFVSDEKLREFYSKTRVAIVPLRFGAGIKGKVIEAIAHGVPIVTTEIGREGMRDMDGVVSVANQPDEFAQSVLDIYLDEQKWVEMRRKQIDHGRKHFSLDYSKRLIRKVLDI